ncbi:hypothetical protein N5B56_01460 [Eubacterium sp. LFL-14]|uniref:Uncharacterized protein n=1 Tax=Eubacterium album TaxID=2978477 RepID=A0ABT2LWS9_9FIRM|nr:hypothetical protein [Eubacterium sp. LFL-14]MCT7397753.1 hypothetical protein [Eubacterium sp. LFL-14]
MRKITEEQRKGLENDIVNIMNRVISSEYINKILNQYDYTSDETLIDAVIKNVLETSADEEYYNEDDIRLAIGRELVARLGAED